jgi:hypothetical protein
VLESALGIRLLLWAGATKPSPRPELLAGVQSVEVTNDADTGDGFQLTFAVGKDLTGGYDVVESGAFELLNRVWIAVVLGVVPEMLIDGVVTRHDLRPSWEPGRSTFTVTGSDVALKLDLEERNEGYSNQPDSVIVTNVLDAYPELGLVPRVTATTDVPTEADRVPHQHETDLQFIRRFARRNGFVFYLEPLTVGTNTAHWGPVIRGGLPQRALTSGQGPFHNVRSLTFANDGLAPVAAGGAFLDPITKQKVPIPPLPPLRLPPLAARATPAARKRLLRTTANAGPAQTALASVATATGAPEPVSGQGELDTVRYGAVLRARGLVGVRGAGRSNNGTYYVRSVTHQIRIGSYTQSFTLSREGTGSLSPVVRP